MKQALTQLSEHVWLWPFATGENVTQSSVGIVRGDKQTVLIDAGNGSPLANRIKFALQAAKFPPVSHIIYTHHHWDHVFGAYVFQPQEVIANQRSVPFLQEKAAIVWNGRYLQAQIAEQPQFAQRARAQLKAAGNWDFFRMVLPTLTFDETHSLTLDNGLLIEMKHVPGIHSPDAVAVGIPKDGLCFVGDAYYPPPSYEATAENKDAGSTEAINAFYEERYHTYIDGHNELITARQMRLLGLSNQLMRQKKR